MNELARMSLVDVGRQSPCSGDRFLFHCIEFGFTITTTHPMNKSEVVERLEGFKARLQDDVISAYAVRGREFGGERFAAWRRQVSAFLDQHLPGTRTSLDAKLHHMVFTRGRSESDLDVFLREDGTTCIAFLDSLLIDVQNNEFDFAAPTPVPSQGGVSSRPHPGKSKRVFIVHGHDHKLLSNVARFIEKLEYEPVILHEQASKGMTIIEKIEAHTEVGFAIVLYTADDKGNAVGDAAKGQLNDRARQNVVFEHGYLIAKLTRANVVPLMAGCVEIPSDISGVVYIDDANWQVEIAKEMVAAGYDVDFNKLLKPK